MAGSQVVAELRVGCQGIGPESGGAANRFPFTTHVRQGKALGVILRPVFPLQDDGETLGLCRLPFGLGNPPGRGVAPAELLAGQLVPPSELGERTGVVALIPEDSAEMEVGQGALRLEPDLLAVGGDGLVQLPLSFQRRTRPE